MALEYKLALQKPEDETVVLDQLVSVDGFVRGGDGIQAPDLFVSVRKPSDLTVEVIKDEFGFVPHVQVWFRLHGDGDTDAARLRIVYACMALLQLGSGDAVSLFNGDQVVLLRQNGQLVLNRDLGFWTDERLALVTLPYRLDGIPHI
jgi:hypothetical protein